MSLFFERYDYTLRSGTVPLKLKSDFYLIRLRTKVESEPFNFSYPDGAWTKTRHPFYVTVSDVRLRVVHLDHLGGPVLKVDGLFDRPRPKEI